MVAQISKLVAVICFAVLVSRSDFANAQQQPRTSVQLPTIRFFGVNTTVWVPVGGRTVLGSVKRSSHGSVSRGVPLVGNIPVAGRAFGNRGIGSSNSASTASVQVQLHDLHAMDKALLEEARRDKIAKLGGPEGVKKYREELATEQFADFITKNMGRTAINLR